MTPQPPEAILDLIGPHTDVIVPMANGEPVTLLDTLDAHGDELTGVRVHQMHALHDRPYLHGAYGDKLRHVSYFLSHVTRPRYWDGTVDLVPNNFSEMPMLLRRCLRYPVVLAAASPPDAHGHFSLGTNAEYVARFIGRATWFLEVNPRMPRTSGLNQIHISQIAGYTEAERPLVEVPPIVPSEKDHAIAAMIVDRIPDRATLQIGIGGVPNAVLASLTSHRDLGVHTELLADGVMDLVERGVVTGVHKRLRPNKVVTTFALGSQRLYDWMDDNHAVELLPVDEVNDPRIVAGEPRFVSINATTEVDLYGQCASETVAGRYWSSSGGQADFARGAMYSEDGQAFIVVHSTTKKGRSRIRAQLTPGSVVTTLKNTVDNVVTEHGIAELKGVPISERARRLIAVAAPEHREELERDAREAGIL
jgi:acyl-CoA hydrolase